MPRDLQGVLQNSYFLTTQELKTKQETKENNNNTTVISMPTDLFSNRKKLKINGFRYVNTIFRANRANR